MWWLLAFVSAALLGCYDSAKKISLKGNAVIPVLLLNTALSALIFSPFLFATGFGGWAVQKYILLKSALVLSSWIYFCTAQPPNPVENRNGEKMAADRTVFRKRTGMTALPPSDTFFAES